MLLEVNDLSISYGKGNPVVHGVSFPWTKENSCHHRGIRLGEDDRPPRCRPYPAKAGTSDRRTHPFEGKESETKTIREKTSFIFQDSGAMLNPIRTIGTEFSEYLAAHGITGGEAEDRMTNLLSQVRLPDPAGILKSYPSNCQAACARESGLQWRWRFIPS